MTTKTVKIDDSTNYHNFELIMFANIVKIDDSTYYHNFELIMFANLDLCLMLEMIECVS